MKENYGPEISCSGEAIAYVPRLICYTNKRSRRLPKWESFIANTLSTPTFKGSYCKVVIVSGSERRKSESPWDDYRLGEIPTSAIFSIEQLPLARLRARKPTYFGSLALPVAHKTEVAQHQNLLLRARADGFTFHYPPLSHYP